MWIEEKNIEKYILNFLQECKPESEEVMHHDMEGGKSSQPVQGVHLLSSLHSLQRLYIILYIIKFFHY